MVRKLSCLTLSFCLILIFIRAEAFGEGYSFVLQGFSTFKRVLLISYEDLIFAFGLAGFFMVLSRVYRKKPVTLRRFYNCYLGALFISLIWAILNIEAVKILNTPVNYQLLYYSNIMGSKFVADFMGNSFSGLLLIKVMGLCVTMLLAARILDSLSRRLTLSPQVRVVISGVLAAAAIFYFVSAYRFVQDLKTNQYDNYGKVANPVLAFAGSMIPFFTSDSRIFAELPPDSLKKYQVAQTHNLQTAIKAAPYNGKVKNVIFFVMESVPAEYVAGYGSKYDATPVIRQHLQEAVLFKDVYAHSPNSTNSLFSMLGSVYPELSFKNVVNEHPEVIWPTLSSELKQKNYRTAFYGFSDNSYMQVDKYLAHRKFDKIIDHKALPCRIPAFNSDAEGAETGKDEMCMVDDFVNWLGKKPEQQPFFGMLWTMQTHWPYFASGKEKLYVKDDPEFNRYLNALHHSDAALGKLLAELKRKNLAESTLVVVVGDHGEAFGRHGQYGHGSSVYEENVRIPLIFINPLLFSGQERSVIGGLVDLPVTVMDVLRYPAPGNWQGSSLFNPNRENVTYFFSTWSDYLYGYRTGEHKVIYNAYTNQTRIYNLHNDPLETTNISAQLPDLVKSSEVRLGHWVQYNRAVLNEAIANSEPASHSAKRIKAGF
jgi:lipoteichoic acid synthase